MARCTELGGSVPRVLGADDTGFPEEASRLLAVALVGMSQVSARFWLNAEGQLPQEQAVELISSLAWRGIRGFPRHGE